jgi:Acyclic terpene utilisation family protein AtuA
MKEKIRIGCGAGFSGDRIEPAVLLAEKGELDYLVLECLAERTIALAQKRKMADPGKGYDPLLERRIESLLPALIKNKVRLITNMGAANPIAAAKKIIEIAASEGIKIKVAAITGDDIIEELQLHSNGTNKFDFNNFLSFPGDDKIIHHPDTPITNDQVVSANAYLGVEAILTALNENAHIIITGRVADPSLFLAPMIHEFGWPADDYTLLGKGTVTGHLLECAGQITGGYFADPVKKPVDNMENPGHPFADVFADGSSIISKADGTGGIVNLQTAKEQLLYEVVNPYEYITPDVVADFTTVHLKEIGKNKVQVSGGNGKAKLPTYKVSVGYKAFYLCEAEISYAGSSAVERAALAGDIIRKRLSKKFPDIRIDYIGIQSAHRSIFEMNKKPYEVRLRVAGKSKTAMEAGLIGEEVEALYTNGPAGGGGVRKYVNEVIGIVSVLIERNKLTPKVNVFQS